MVICLKIFYLEHLKHLKLMVAGAHGPRHFNEEQEQGEYDHSRIEPHIGARHARWVVAFEPAGRDQCLLTETCRNLTTRSMQFADGVYIGRKEKSRCIFTTAFARPDRRVTIPPSLSLALSLSLVASPTTHQHFSVHEHEECSCCIFTLC